MLHITLEWLSLSLIVIYIFNFIVFSLVFVSFLRKKYLSKCTSATKANDTNSNNSFLWSNHFHIVCIIMGNRFMGNRIISPQQYTCKRLVLCIVCVNYGISCLFILFIMNGVRSKDVHTVWKQWFNQVTRQDFDHMTRKIVRFMDDKVSKSP